VVDFFLFSPRLMNFNNPMVEQSIEEDAPEIIMEMGE